ncbi:4Fe-4S binding protein [Candidatus Bipolaricaulota bacterium]|nr:4Fe-4S binding protein [Candidatus Bipolaricaulota bacterium]
MRLPKLRELKEAITAVFSPRFTSRFPAEPCVVPERYRGKPEFDLDDCIGCGACVNVCPTNALTQIDDSEANPPVRKITLQADACIFCGNCSDNCTTETGIKLSNKWDLANMDRATMTETYEFELQLCEKCGAIIGTKKHLVWLYEKLGPLAYTNPSLLIAKSGELLTKPQGIQPQPDITIETSDFMRILCPKCKCELNIRL